MAFRTLNTGATGLRAQGEAINVVGSNIANVNTVGYKRQDAQFENMFLKQLGANGNAGGGVRLAGVRDDFNQGAVTDTGIATDLALSGDGFFVVNGNFNGREGNYFTRDGQFQINEMGEVVTSGGMNVQGYAARADGTFSATLADLALPTEPLAPRATETVEIAANIDSQELVIPAAWDPQDPTATSNFSTGIQVHDSLGESHTMDVYFRKTGANTWDYFVIANGDDLDPPVPGLNVQVGDGNLTFDNSGALDTMTPTTPIAVTYPGAAAQTIELDLGTSITDGGTGLDGLTQFSATSAVTAQSQDGHPAGDLVGITVNQLGIIEGTYSNGEMMNVGRVAVAKFKSNDGLDRADGGLWVASNDSGDPAIGAAGTGGRGLMAGGSVEGSNVDLGTEFVKLIQYQRAYSASAKTITTANEMLQELVNLKR